MSANDREKSPHRVIAGKNARLTQVYREVKEDIMELHCSRHPDPHRDRELNRQVEDYLYRMLGTDNPHETTLEQLKAARNTALRTVTDITLLPEPAKPENPKVRTLRPGPRPDAGGWR